MEKFRNLVKNVYVRIIKKSVVNYNVEERAIKAISQPKKVPAPQYLTTHQKVMKYIEEHPEVKDIVVEKPKQLIEWLKQIKVVSKGSVPQVLPKHGVKPVTREPQPVPERYGNEGEVKVIPPGRITLAQAFDLCTESAYHPEKYEPKELAKSLNLEEQDVENLVKHFKPFEFIIPPQWKNYDQEAQKKSLDYIWKNYQLKSPILAADFPNYTREDLPDDEVDFKTKEQIMLEAKEEEKRKLLKASEMDDRKQISEKKD